MFREAGHFQRERDGSYTMVINRYYKFKMTKQEIKDCHDGKTILNLTKICEYSTLAGTQTVLEEKEENYIMYLGKSGKAFIIEFLKENKKFSLPKIRVYIIMGGKEDKCELAESISLEQPSEKYITPEELEKMVLDI